VSSGAGTDGLYNLASWTLVQGAEATEPAAGISVNASARFREAAGNLSGGLFEEVTSMLNRSDTGQMLRKFSDRGISYQQMARATLDTLSSTAGAMNSSLMRALASTLSGVAGVHL
jgi:hypothetical protein